MILLQELIRFERTIFDVKLFDFYLSLDILFLFASELWQDDGKNAMLYAC